MSYEEKIKAWVARRLEAQGTDCDVRNIESVSSYTSSVSGCETCDWGAGTIVNFGVKFHDGAYKSLAVEIGDDGERFEDVLKEIIEA